MNRLGQTIYLWRTLKGWSQAELARKVGLPRPNLSDIETGKHDMTVGTLERFAQAFETTPGTLVDQKLPVSGKDVNSLSRNSLDRIAARSVGKTVRVNQQESAIAHLLGKLVQNRVDALQDRFRKLRFFPRSENGAWLQLQAMTSPALLKNLFERVAKQTVSHGSPAD